MSYAYHGNYCGPNWTGGEYIDSSRGNYNIEPVDEFDQTCKEHDLSYRDGDYYEADKRFVQQNKGKGLKRDLAANLVQLQSKLRKLNIMPKSDKTKKQIKAVKKEIKKVERAPKMKMKMKPKQKTKFVGASVYQTKPFKKTRVVRQSSDGVTIVGTEQIGNIQVLATAQPGDILMNFTLSPQSFVNQKLAVHATLWEMYEFLDATIIYYPVDGTQFNSNIIAGLDYDATDTYASGVTNVNKLLESDTKFETQSWQPARMHLRRNLKAQGKFFTSAKSDLTRTVQARLLVIANSTFSTARTIGNIVIQYKIRFYGNQLDPAGGNVINPLAFPKFNTVSQRPGVVTYATSSAGGASASIDMLGTQSFYPLTYQAANSPYVNFNVKLNTFGTYFVVYDIRHGTGQNPTYFNLGLVSPNNYTVTYHANIYNVMVSNPHDEVILYALVTILPKNTSSTLPIQFQTSIQASNFATTAVNTLFSPFVMRLGTNNFSIFDTGKPLEPALPIPPAMTDEDKTNKRIQDLEELIKRLSFTPSTPRRAVKVPQVEYMDE